MNETINITPLTPSNTDNFSLCGTDELGRKVSPISSYRNDKLVGLFYFLWLGYHSEEGQMFSDIRDISKMSEEELFSFEGSPFGEMYFWGEPKFGYYSMLDRWVIERHVRMFLAAGIDFLAFDTTNNDIFSSSLDVVLDVLLEYQSYGYDVPKIMFLTNTNSAERVTQIYEHVYQNGRYNSLWFTDTDNGKNGDKKPWITFVSNQQVYLKKEIREFFYFKDSQWPNQSFLDNGFPWIEFGRPQKSHDGIISVSVAQNAGMHMSDSVQFENSPNDKDYYNANWGRGYTTTGKNNKSKIAEGANFQEQWDVALSSDPHIVFVTGWNEWAALKLATTVEGIGNSVVFFDCFNDEFSRDIEPMKGGFGDNYYMQLIENIRVFKGIKGGGISTAQKTISSWTDWNGVLSGAVNFDSGKARNGLNADLSEKYINETARNVIQELRFASDKENLYLLITCKGNIVYASDKYFMNVLINTNGEKNYNFTILNASNGKAEINDSNGETIGYAQYTMQGKYLSYTIPLSVLSGAKSFEIKVSDNANYTDSMNFYDQGSAAPYGRLNYSVKLP